MSIILHSDDAKYYNENKSEKTYGTYTEQISENEFHVAVKKIEMSAEVKKTESLEEFDKRLAKKFWNEFWLSAGVAIFIFLLAGGISFIQSS